MAGPDTNLKKKIQSKGKEIRITLISVQRNQVSIEMNNVAVRRNMYEGIQGEK